MKKMTSRERVIAASRREPVDTIPVSPRLGYAVRYHCGSSSIPNMLRLKKTYDFDPVMQVTGIEYPFVRPLEIYSYAPGVNVELDIKDEGGKRIVDKTVHTPDGDMHETILVPNPGHSEYGFSPNPTRTDHLVKTREDLLKLRHLMPRGGASHADEYHGWDYIVGEEGSVWCTLYGPIDNQAGEVMSVENLMINYLLDREFVVELVDMFWQRIMKQTKVLLEHGVRNFFIPWYWHSLSVGWSPAIYREWFLPMIKEQVDLIHSYNGLANLYDDGDTMGIMPMMIEAGVDVFETCTPPPMCDFDLYKAKEICDGKMTLKGYIDLLHVIKEGTVEDVRSTIEEACQVLGENGGFILGTTDSFREETPIENIDAYFKYCRQYGKRS